ncbi:UPF0147 family protein [Candidatus Woesearchaeota archaeon]|nr:UPF0147 family protein [Candidatus Woesearchaeota archaeon]
METILQAVELLIQIEQDLSVPKNVRVKVKNAMTALQEESLEQALKINKSLQELDDIAADPNIPSFTRTQIWNVVSLLETQKP